MSLGIPQVTLPRIPEDSPSSSPNMVDIVQKKSTTLLKGTQLAIQWFRDYATSLTPAQISELNLSEESLKESLVIKALLSNPDTSKTTKETSNKAHALALEILEDCCYTAQKTEELVEIFHHLGIKYIPFGSYIHGAGCLATVATSGKSLWNSLSETKENKKVAQNPLQQQFKKIKFSLNGMVAIAGLFTLMVHSIKLSFIYLGLSTLALGANFLDDLVDSTPDPHHLEKKAIQKYLQSPSNFTMCV